MKSLSSFAERSVTSAKTFATCSVSACGAPLFAPSTTILRRFSAATAGRFLLIGVGGIGSGADAYAKIRAGACAVQLYSALAFEGPGLVTRIKRDLVLCLRADGFRSVSEAIGAE